MSLQTSWMAMLNLQATLANPLFGRSLLTAVRGVEYVVPMAPKSYELWYINICSVQYAEVFAPVSI